MFHKFLSIFLGSVLFNTLPSFAQTNYGFVINTTAHVCLKATAGVEISGTHAGDTIHINWSTGQSDVAQIFELEGGNYHVNIRIKHLQDTVYRTSDTTLYFKIESEQCVVQVDKYFSPNDDNYHDLLSISNIEKYPDFELHIYNKWGQVVHSQKKTYTPWNGKWIGIDLPDGTYYYVLFYNAGDKNKLVKGDITILR